MTYLFSQYWYCWFHPHSEGEGTYTDNWHQLVHWIISYLAMFPSIHRLLHLKSSNSKGKIGSRSWQNDSSRLFFNPFVPGLTYLLVFIVCLTALLLQLGDLRKDLLTLCARRGRKGREEQEREGGGCKFVQQCTLYLGLTCKSLFLRFPTQNAPAQL